MQTFLSVVFKYEEKINAFIDDLYKQKGGWITPPITVNRLF